MYTNPRPEKIAHLVMSSTDSDAFTRHEQVRDYSEVHGFIKGQPTDAEVQFTWYYLDPQLRRRLVLTCAQHAISLGTTSLEIPHFTAESHEFYRESQPEVMGSLVLNASGIFEANSARDHIHVGMENPRELHEYYHALRQQTEGQLRSTPESRSLDASVREFSSSAPAA